MAAPAKAQKLGASSLFNLAGVGGQSSIEVLRSSLYLSREPKLVLDVLGAAGVAFVASAYSTAYYDVRGYDHFIFEITGALALGTLAIEAMIDPNGSQWTQVLIADSSFPAIFELAGVMYSKIRVNYTFGAGDTVSNVNFIAYRG